MNWNSDTPENFPAAVQRAALPGGTAVLGRYVIREAVYVSGMELYYRAVDQASAEEITLCELLPMQWCMQDENGDFVPYQETTEQQWTLFREAALSRLQSMQASQEDASPSALLDVFEDRGTVWYAMHYRETKPLRTLMNEKLLSPKAAIDLMAPILDTLAGLHGDGIIHGAVTDTAIRLAGEEAELRDWNSAEDPTDIYADVQAVSRLLYKMMTGETEYRSLAAASLPAPVRNALYNGMNDRSMTIPRLWEELHAKKAAKRVRIAVAKQEDDSLLGRIFNPVVTAVFCLGCVLVPLLLWGKAMKTNEQKSVPAAVAKFQDVAYALSEDQLVMPELLGIPQEEAIRQIEGLGMHVILSKREANPVIPENCVITQKPDAGMLVEKGITVTLSVSSGWSNYVPDVVNMRTEEAQQKLEDLGFVVELEEVVSPGDAPGTVISQSIKPETKLERDKTVKLTVSLGRSDLDKSKMEEIGDYVGMDFAKAKELLAELHLYAMQTEMVYDAATPAGTILAQDIPAGQKAPQGTIINMTVSRGMEMTRVPSVVLMSASNAKATLESAGLICVMCYVSNNEYAMDVVLSQNTAEGMLVATGSQVWLNVSIGSGSSVQSTGGWSGAPLPTFEHEEEDSEEEQPEEPEQPEQPQEPQEQQTDPPPVIFQPTEPPPVQTEPPYVEPDPPPAPDTPPAPDVNPDPGLEPPPMPQ
ncbi:MAG: PASTA domain-containing protein [Oscillospiraceae bacterium]|nr:PASTA domain-containing protein [Oscillospiraceae bacterium]